MSSPAAGLSVRTRSKAFLSKRINMLRSEKEYDARRTPAEAIVDFLQMKYGKFDTNLRKVQVFQAGRNGYVDDNMEIQLAPSPEEYRV